jgi:hypothetical protein
MAVCAQRGHHLAESSATLQGSGELLIREKNEKEDTARSMEAHIHARSPRTKHPHAPHKKNVTSTRHKATTLCRAVLSTTCLLVESGG